MKRVLSVFLVFILTLTLNASFLSCGKGKKESNNTYDQEKTDVKEIVLNVFNWAAYISDGSEGLLDVNAEFEERTGIKVNYVTFENNEAMYSKLASGSVNIDVAIPSDYMIERLIKENRLKELDFGKIPNYRNISEKYKNMYYDPDNKYSVPYSVGYLGLIYNTKFVKTAPDSWRVMWDPQYKDVGVYNIDNSRDSFLIGQLVAGVDPNSTDKADWDRAADELRTLNSNVRGYVMDQAFDKMEQGNAAIVPYYAGDFLTMKENNPDLEMVYPKEGTNVFVDAACIPTTCENYDEALQYINFLLDPEIALANAEYIRYASPNTAVLNDPYYSLKDNEYIYPQEEPKAVYYYDLPEDITKYYENLWSSIKGD